MLKQTLTAALLVIATPASADIVTVTVTGTIAPVTWSGSRFVSTALIDNGTFGTAGQSLFGDAFVALWTVDTGCITCNYVSGGSVSGVLPATPIVSSSLTINGVTVNFVGGAYGVMYDYHDASRNSAIATNNGFFDAFYINTTVAPGTTAMNNFVNTFGGVMPGDINTSFSYVVNPLTDNIDRNGLGGSFSYGGLSGYLNTTEFTITNMTHPVPGPVAGAGLPGLVIAAAGLLAWWRRKRHI